MMRAPKPVLLLAALLLAASVSAAAWAANRFVVSQKARAFSTANLQISRGDTVSFSNDDKFVHQIYVESPGLTYESDEQPPGTNVEVAFPRPGLFEVRCHIHPKMLLRVDVR